MAFSTAIQAMFALNEQGFYRLGIRDLLAPLQALFNEPAALVQLPAETLTRKKLAKTRYDAMVITLAQGEVAYREHLIRHIQQAYDKRVTVPLAFVRDMMQQQTPFDQALTHYQGLASPSTYQSATIF
jgi:hypothetical protein